jgi:hypothetical protein
VGVNTGDGFASNVSSGAFGVDASVCPFGDIARLNCDALNTERTRLLGVRADLNAPLLS